MLGDEPQSQSELSQRQSQYVPKQRTGLGPVGFCGSGEDFFKSAALSLTKLSKHNSEPPDILRLNKMIMFKIFSVVRIV